MFTSETGFRARQRKAGLAAARYWEARAFENLEKAREARRFYAARRREWYRINEKREHRYAYVPPAGAWRCDCGLTGDSMDKIYLFHQQSGPTTSGLVPEKKDAELSPPTFAAKRKALLRPPKPNDPAWMSVNALEQPAFLFGTSPRNGI